MNEDFDVHVINTIQMIAAGHDCRIAAIDPENRSIRLEGCRDEAELARKLADVLD